MILYSTWLIGIYMSMIFGSAYIYLVLSNDLIVGEETENLLLHVDHNAFALYVY